MRCGADNCQELERLCRYISRLAVANERVQCIAAGQVVLTLKTPWRDGTTHLVMSPLEFMQRLAARVPRPRLHLMRFYRVLTPTAELRALVVPYGPVEGALAARPPNARRTVRITARWHWRCGLRTGWRASCASRWHQSVLRRRPERQARPARPARSKCSIAGSGTAEPTYQVPG